MSYFLSFDVGTTAMKCILFDSNFNEVFYANHEYNIISEKEGMAELQPQKYFNTFLDCIEDIKNSDFDVLKITSITFTTQGETFIPVDKDGNELMNAIIWLDSRADKEAKLIEDSIDSYELYKNTGLAGIDGALPSAKLLWIKNNEPEVYKNTYKFLLLEDYLIMKLTGKFVSEKSLQSSTGWYNIISEEFYGDMISVCGIDTDKLPEVLPCATIVGNITDEIADKYGLSKDTVVTTGAMDQIASCVGIGNVKEGIFTETTGTALVACSTVKKPVFSKENPIMIYKHFDDNFVYIPYEPTAGMTLKWFKDNIMPYAHDKGKQEGLSTYDYIGKVAQEANILSNGVIMLPQLASGGGFANLTLAAKTSDLARSVYEGVSYMLKSIVDSIENMDIKIDEVFSLGGGSYSAFWCQIKADMLNKKVIAVDYAQTTALGAAILASVAIGENETVNKALEKINNGGKAYNPNAENNKIYKEGYNNYQKFLNN